MIKDCTTEEQGRLLMGIGIDPETADKCWIAIENGDEPAMYPMSFEQANENRMTADKFMIDIAKEKAPGAMTPAWSLTALLELLPAEIESEGVNYPFSLIKRGTEYQACYSRESGILYSILEDTPVNAVVKMLFLLDDIKNYN